MASGSTDLKKVMHAICDVKTQRHVSGASPNGNTSNTWPLKGDFLELRLRNFAARNVVHFWSTKGSLKKEANRPIAKSKNFKGRSNRPSIGSSVASLSRTPRLNENPSLHLTNYSWWFELMVLVYMVSAWLVSLLYLVTFLSHSISFFSVSPLISRKCSANDAKPSPRPRSLLLAAEASATLLELWKFHDFIEFIGEFIWSPLNISTF